MNFAKTIAPHEPIYFHSKEIFVYDRLTEIKEGLSIVNKIKNNFVPTFGRIVRRVFSNLCYANIYSIPNVTYNYLYYANQLNHSWFQYTINDEKPVTLKIADKLIDTIGQFKNENIGAVNVISGIQMALVLRDNQALSFYADIPLAFTEQANQEDIIYDTILLFYQVLINGNGTQNEAQATYHHLNKVLNWEEYKRFITIEDFNQEWVWKIIFEMRKQTAEYVFLPLLNLYHQILHNNQAGYEVAVEQALLKWKAYYTLRYKDENGEEQDHSTLPEGYLSLPIVSACAYAYDRGLKLTNIQSAYIPEWMIERKFEAMELLVKDNS
ncbi:hypothetical protein GCM10027341_16220 [Spirosoma knui]